MHWGPLTYNEDTIVLKEIDGSNEMTLTKGTDYTVTFTSDKKGMTLVVPDGKHLKLTYSARLNLKTYTDSSKNESLTEENSKNTFSLFGFSSKQTKGETSYNQVAYTPKASETGSVTIKKFWTDDGTYTALAGSVFKIVRATYGADTGKMVDGAVIKDNIEVGVDGTITVKNLRKDWFYALYETKAKDGYARRTDPYYFIIDDDDSVTLPSGITIEKFVNDENVLEYENQLEAVLYITKTVENENWDNVKNDITFTVKKGDLVIATVNGADMTKNGGVYVAAINQLEVGEYTVTEVLNGENAAYTRTTTYTARTNGTGETAVSAPISDTANSVVAFTNTYTAKTGEIEVTKKFGGTGFPIEFESVTRTVENEAGTGETAVSVPVQDSMYSVETFDNTYTEKTGKVDGSLASIHVSDGTSAKVAFENTYEKNTTPPSPQKPEPTPTDLGTPGTGDNSNPALWFILFAVSGTGLAVLAVLYKKNKKKQ